MKKISYAAMALFIAFGGAAVSKANAQRFVKVPWLLKPGRTGADALIATAYTHASGPLCNGSLTLCGIIATATALHGKYPNLSADAVLHADLLAVSEGNNSNFSGKFFLRIDYRQQD